MRQPAQPSSSDLVLLGEVIRSVVRRGRLPPADAEDFSQGVQLKFLELGTRHSPGSTGRSSLRTYLTTVVWRLLLDWRTAAYGKWRPSAAARRLGPQAVRLDRLLNRDGLTVDEAIQVASRTPDASPEHVLRLIADRLPRRRRHVVVPDDVLQLVAREFPDPIEARERAVKARRTRLRARPGVQPAQARRAAAHVAAIPAVAHRSRYSPASSTSTPGGSTGRSIGWSASCGVTWGRSA